MQFKRIFLLSVLCVSLGVTGYSQIGGSTTYNFMVFPVSARSSALGGNYVTARDADLSLADGNPSFLDSNVDKKIDLTYVPYYAGIDYGYAAYAQTFKKVGTFDASIKYLNYGTFTQADASGNITGSFSAIDYLLNIGYGRPIKDSTFSVGANLKMISSRLSQYTSLGAAIDLGGSYVSPNKRFFAGLVVQNVGTQFKEYYSGTSEVIPFDVHGGVAVKLKHAPFRFNITLQHLQTWDLTYSDPVDTETVNPLTGQKITQSKITGFADKLMRHVVPGVEALLGKNFAIRIGYNYETRQELELAARRGLVGFSAGFGIKIYKFELNYSWAEYDLVGASNTFTIAINLNEFMSHNSETSGVPGPPERPILPLNR